MKKIKGMFGGKKKRRGSGKEADGEDDGALDPASGSSPAAPGEAASASSNPRPNPRPEGQSGAAPSSARLSNPERRFVGVMYFPAQSRARQCLEIHYS